MRLLLFLIDEEGRQGYNASKFVWPQDYWNRARTSNCIFRTRLFYGSRITNFFRLFLYIRAEVCKYLRQYSLFGISCYFFIFRSCGCILYFRQIYYLLPTSRTICFSNLCLIWEFGPKRINLEGFLIFFHFILYLNRKI